MGLANRFFAKESNGLTTDERNQSIRTAADDRGSGVQAASSHLNVGLTTSAWESGKYWAKLMSVSFVGFSVIAWLGNVIVPWVLSVIYNGKTTVSQNTVNSTFKMTITLIVAGTIVSFILGAIVGCVRHLLGIAPVPSPRQKRLEDQWDD